MAENQDGMEKTEQATPKRLSDAQQKGQVSKSTDVTTAALLLLGGSSIFLFGPNILGNVQGLMRTVLQNSATMELTEANVIRYTGEMFLFLAQILLPVIALIFLIGFLGDASQIGVKWATKKFTEGLRWKQIFNPFSGLKNVFASKNAVVELLKNVLKVSILGIVIYFILEKRKEEVIGLLERPFIEIGSYMVDVGFEMVWKVGLAYIIIALADFYYQRWRFSTDMKMTKREVKDESKQAEGDPMIKSRLRSLMRGRLRRLMMKNVKAADVVITNPTHFAVALVYKQGEMGAPKVVAKGADHMAFKIREIATENNVPIVEDPPLARALYANVDFDEEVPENLFKAVAQVLAYVYSLKDRKN